MAVISLNLQQSNAILHVLASLRGNARAKLCYSDTAICLESDSSLWRTAAETYNTYVAKWFTGNPWDRDISSFPLLISRVVACLMQEVKEVQHIEATVIDLKNAQEGLLQLQERQYLNCDKGAFITTAFRSLLLVQEQLEKRLPPSSEKPIYPRFAEKSDAELSQENAILKLEAMAKDIDMLKQDERIEVLEQALRQLQPDHPLLKRN